MLNFLEKRSNAHLPREWLHPHTPICQAFHLQSSFPASRLESVRCLWWVPICSHRHWAPGSGNAQIPTGVTPRSSATEDAGFKARICAGVRLLHRHSLPMLEILSLLEMGEVRFFHWFKATLPNPEYIQIETCQSRVKFQQLKAFNLKL